MSKVKNGIDVFLPTDRDRTVEENRAGLNLAEAMERYYFAIQRCWGDSKYGAFQHIDDPEFFECVPISSGWNRSYDLAYLMKTPDWGDSSAARKYYETVPFTVLQSFAYRLVRFLRYLEQTEGAFEVRRVPAGISGTTESGIQLKDGKVLVWFVKYGAGRFALDLNDISEETARSFNFLGRPIEYGGEEEKAVLRTLGIYPIATVAENRCQPFFGLWDGLRNISDYEYERDSRLQAQWELNDVDVLPTNLLKVNLLEMPERESANRKAKYAERG